MQRETRRGDTFNCAAITFKQYKNANIASFVHYGETLATADKK